MRCLDFATKALLALLVAGVWGLLVRPFFVATAAPAERQASAVQSFDEINVKRINIVENNGKTRLVLASSDRMPNPVVDGRELIRTVKLAGILFCKADGTECGGVGVHSGRKTEQAMCLFDYKKNEAIGFQKYESKDGKNFNARFVLLDRPPLELPLEKRMKRSRSE